MNLHPLRVAGYQSAQREEILPEWVREQRRLDDAPPDINEVDDPLTSLTSREDKTKINCTGVADRDGRIISMFPPIPEPPFESDEALGLDSRMYEQLLDVRQGV